MRENNFRLRKNVAIASCTKQFEIVFCASTI